jgi:hypothetical protein
MSWRSGGFLRALQKDRPMALTVKCPLCGEVVTGANEDSLVAAADKHGDEKHNGMKAPRAMVVGAARHTD